MKDGEIANAVEIGEEEARELLRNGSYAVLREGRIERVIGCRPEKLLGTNYVVLGRVRRGESVFYAIIDKDVVNYGAGRMSRQESIDRIGSSSGGQQSSEGPDEVG